MRTVDRGGRGWFAPQDARILEHGASQMRDTFVWFTHVRSGAGTCKTRDVSKCPDVSPYTVSSWVSTCLLLFAHGYIELSYGIL